MTSEEYKAYQKKVAAFFKDENIENLSADSDGDGTKPPYFSNISCDCCGSASGGDRYDCTGYNRKENEVQEYEVCPDCLYYAEYGQLDDMTMMSIEEEL
jgi:hypothetical protein